MTLRLYLKLYKCPTILFYTTNGDLNGFNWMVVLTLELRLVVLEQLVL
jgi:hypothetical protein